MRWFGGTLAVQVALLLLVCQIQVEGEPAVHGGWGEWSFYRSQCNATCEGGKQEVFRTCHHPTPQNNGRKCLLEGSQSERAMREVRLVDCNTHSCDVTWSDWEDCYLCRRNPVKRHTLCGNGTCMGDDAQVEEQYCNNWIRGQCPDPCQATTNPCPQRAFCTDTSSLNEPKFECKCTGTYIMNDGETSCVNALPPTTTERPIPTMDPADKVVATVMSKSASSILIVFVSMCLILFLILGIFTPDRVIQMNMEIALLLAHICLMAPAEATSYPTVCRWLSIGNHFFFTACYAFIMLESLHMYSLVSFVVKKGGMFSRLQNTIIGWGLAAIIILLCIAFQYDNYGGEYHCWLQMNTPLVYAQLTPVIIFSFLSLTLIEAAGSAEYKPLMGIDGKQLFSAKISQRTNLFILPFVIAHMLVGMLSEYQQNLPLYGTFSALNGVTGALIFILHTANNQKVREKMKSCCRNLKRG